MMGLPCAGCAYRESIPGDTHSRCVFKWEGPMPQGKPHGIKNGWFVFPLNYDPIWGPDQCGNRSKTREPGNVAAANPLLDLMSLFGRRML